MKQAPMLLRYRVIGFVTYRDDAGRRSAIPVGQLVEIAQAPDGSGTLTWRDPAGRVRIEELSDRLLLHYTASHLEPVEPLPNAAAPRQPRPPSARHPFRAFR